MPPGNGVLGCGRVDVQLRLEEGQLQLLVLTQLTDGNLHSKNLVSRLDPDTNSCNALS